MQNVRAIKAKKITDLKIAINTLKYIVILPIMSVCLTLFPERPSVLPYKRLLFKGKG